MSNMIRTFFMMFVIALSTCVVPKRTTQMSTPFRVEDFAWSLQPGTATITGQAFLKTRGGDVKTCAGSTVELIPNTAYVREVLSHLRSGVDPIRDQAYYTYRLKTTCHAPGNFIFNNVAAGDWLIQTTVFWYAPSGSRYVSNLRQGGLIWCPFTLAKDQKLELILADADLQ